MNDLICERCGSHQAQDHRPDDRCPECGSSLHPATRCFGCHGVIPHIGRCPRCALPTLPRDLYSYALIMRYGGIDLPIVADRTMALSPAQRKLLDETYPDPWRRADEAMDQLADLLSVRVNPTMSRLVLITLDKMRMAPEVTPDKLLAAIAASQQQFSSTLPSVPPFSLAVCKAVHEAAPWKLTELQWRLKSGLPARGIDETGKTGLACHSEALSSAYGPEDARFSIAVSYLNTLTSSHSLVLGEVFGKADRTPVFELFKASQGGESQDPAVPVSLVRDHGVIYALGPHPTFSLEERWVPQGFRFVSREGTRIDLHEVDGVRKFLDSFRLPIQPQTLGSLIHILLCPFPWDTRVTVLNEDLINDWAPLETKIGEEHSAGTGSLTTVARPELVFRLEPSGKTVTYRPPAVEIA